eukprot:tig00000382_g24571.t1
MSAAARQLPWPPVLGCRASRPPSIGSRAGARAFASLGSGASAPSALACGPSSIVGASGAPSALPPHIYVLSHLLLRRTPTSTASASSPTSSTHEHSCDPRIRARQPSSSPPVPLSPVQRIRAGFDLKEDQEPDVTAVRTALTMNAGIATAKIVIGFWTGSHTVLSEAAHSVGDTLQQGLLWYGIAKSKRKADSKHPYGYYRERYLWALVSASAALRANARRKGQSTWEAIRSGEDNTTAAVLLEDSAAIVGNIVAAFCIGTRTVPHPPPGGGRGESSSRPPSRLEAPP